MNEATQLFSANVLADPHAEQVRRTLPLLASDDRITQLCNIEAMEQIHRSRPEFEPDYLVADAMSDATLGQLTLEATGGAFRSKQSWFDVRYRCQVTRDLRQVVSFAFLVGKEIPRSAWKSHYLTLEKATQE